MIARPDAASSEMIRWTSTLAPMSMPARRLVEDQDPRPGGQPLGQDDLLLVAAGQRPDLLVDAGHPDVELLGVLRGDRRARSTARTRSRGNRRGRIGSVTFWAIEKSSTRPSWWRSSGR